MVATLLCWNMKFTLLLQSCKVLMKYKANLGNVWRHNYYKLLVIAGVKWLSVSEIQFKPCIRCPKTLCYFSLLKRQIIFQIHCSHFREDKKIHPNFSIDPVLSEHTILQTIMTLSWRICIYIFHNHMCTAFSVAKANTFRNLYVHS